MNHYRANVGDMGEWNAFLERVRPLGEPIIQAGLQPFVERFHAFREGSAAAIGIDESTRAITRMRDEYAEIIARARKKDGSVAAHYNIFDILGVSSFEETTHSAFLANLLSSQGSHAQGDIFMRTFIDRVIPKSRRLVFASLAGDDYEVVCEKGGIEFGWVDVLIEAADKTGAVIIENKIFAADQENQLQRYYDYATQVLRYDEKQIAMIYLTPDGHPVSSYSLRPEKRRELIDADVLVEISYEQDIASWLETVLSKVRAPAVSEIIRQYIKTLKLICRR